MPWTTFHTGYKQNLANVTINKFTMWNIKKVETIVLELSYIKYGHIRTCLDLSYVSLLIWHVFADIVSKVQLLPLKKITYISVMKILFQITVPVYDTNAKFIFTWSSYLKKFKENLSQNGKTGHVLKAHQNLPSMRSAYFR